MASSSTARHNQTEPKHAIDQLAPSPASTSTKSWQIFINHRGPDVKHTFASKIHQTLDGMGFRAFLDLELEPGDVIPAEIEAAMTSASLHIAIFSPNYAQSPWCLAELSFMLKTGKKIIPIFYHVEISDLRWVHQEKGIYAHAFSEHEEKGRYTQEKLGEWKKALHNISFHSGHEVNNNGDEARVLKNIVNNALKVMKNVPLWVAEHPLGLDKLVEGFESVAREDEVKITGIVGMGGSGKTTLAKELFNRNFSSFPKCSFVSDVRDAASRNALPEKQKRLLQDLDVQYLAFDNVDKGMAVLANRLSSLRVLIVLDDVDHIDHLNALLPNKDNLGSQSMVIVTSRELGVLKSWGLSCIYKMPGLERSHAEQLFCWHAFLQPSPPPVFESLVEKFIKACNGLPLSLKVLGAQLYGNDSIYYWESLLNKISRILPGDIKQRLQVSYDALDDEEREMFLDVACFFIGVKKSTAIAVWDGSGWSGLHGLQTLVNKCLVELLHEQGYYGEKVIFYGDAIRMHDHLRDMGREIASKHSPYRFWGLEQIDNRKMYLKKRRPIRGIGSADAFVVLKGYRRQLVGNSSRQSKRLKFSNGFQILSAEGNEFTEEFASLSEDLVWLRWGGFPLKNLPPWLILRHLSVLELYGGCELEELWLDNEDPPMKLRELTIRGETKLQRLPSSIGCLKYLKRLSLSFYGSSLPEELCGLCSLEYLKLCSPTLFSLPDCFGNLISLKYINLTSCKELSTLPDSFKQLTHLEYLILSHCEMLSTFPASYDNLRRLKYINLGSCKQLTTLPDSFKQLIHLEKLDLSDCEMLSSLPDGFGNLINLKDINLRNCYQLNTLPDSFSQLIHLEKLFLSDCGMLSTLPDDFGNLTSLKDIFLSCKQLSTLPKSFKQLIHLEKLSLSDCGMLSTLPDIFGNLTSLKEIYLSCKQLSTLPKSFKQLIHLEKLFLSGCGMLSTLPDVFSNLTSLKDIYLSCKQLSTLPKSFKQLIHLEELCLSGCDKISSLPAGLGNLISLETLDLWGCGMLSSLPDDFGNLINLKNISLRDCKQLSMLPESFMQLIHLEKLDLWGCEMLSTLPDDFGNLINLKSIRLSFCEQLNTLPDSFKQLIHLEELCLIWCTKLQLKLDMLENMRKLKVLDLAHCEELADLPPQIMNQASLRELNLTGCVKLRGLPTGTGKLLNLESLMIADCPLIEELSSFTDLASLKRLLMKNCPKVEKIEGLQQSKSLKYLSLKTTWKVPEIRSLEKLEERLETLVLACDTISAVKPCIQSLKECPWHMCIQASAGRVVEPIVNSLEFPDLTVKELEKPSDAGRILRFHYSAPFFCYVKGKDKNEERKVVRIRVSLNKYPQVWRIGDEVDTFFEGENEKAMVVTGGAGRVVEAFYKLLALLE